MKKSPYLRFLNHASFLIESDNSIILFDPWFSGSAFNNGWSLLDNTIKDEEFCGQKILLSFGIKDRKGQPDAFKNINHFDLNFNSQTEISYYSGCNIDFAKLTQTTIEIDVENDSFNLEIDGAKDYLSYKLRYARIK